MDEEEFPLGFMFGVFGLLAFLIFLIFGHMTNAYLFDINYIVTYAIFFIMTLYAFASDHYRMNWNKTVHHGTINGKILIVPNDRNFTIIFDSPENSV